MDGGGFNSLGFWVVGFKGCKNGVCNSVAAH